MKQQTLVHALALTAGVLSIVDGSAAVLGLPSYVVGVLGVAIAVLVYVANQAEALGGSAASHGTVVALPGFSITSAPSVTTSTAVSAPTAPATAAAPVVQPIASVAAQEPPAPPA